MPISKTIISVFLASPSDVSEEREAVSEVVAELNLLWKNSKNLELKLLKWETDAYSTTGKDPQAIINEQVGNGYDMFIGILWKHFGTPTPRANSGTLEEFTIAHDRYAESEKSIRLMFYFKDAPIKPSQVDAIQLGQVKDFKSKIGPEGTLHWPFESTSEFQKLLRLHLTRHIEDWEAGKWVGWTDSSSDNEPSSEVLTPEVVFGDVLADEEEGLFDLTEKGVLGFEHSTEQMAVIGRLTDELGKQFTARTNEINQVKRKGNATVSFKEIANSIANDLKEYADNLSPVAKEFSKNFNSGVDCFSRASTLMIDFHSSDNDQRPSIKNAMLAAGELRSSLSESIEKLSELRGVIAETPRLTTKYNHSRRHALNAMDDFVGKLNSGFSLLNECLKTMESVLGRME